MKGFAEQEWSDLARPGSVAAVYMGKRATRFVQGRLLIHGADRATPVTFIENASRTDQRVVGSTIGTMADDLKAADFGGPVLTFLGLAPRAAQALAPSAQDMQKERA